MGPKPAPILRPELGLQVTQQKWRHFLVKWVRYKAATLTPNNFPPQLIANELYNCCCKRLQNDLHNVGLQVESTEQETIYKITDNAVQTVNKLKHMCDFFKKDQEEDENLCQYGARLKAATKLCDFTIGSGKGKSFLSTR